MRRSPGVLLDCRCRVRPYGVKASAQAPPRPTDIVTERGDEGIAWVKEMIGGYGAHSVIEAVGAQESMMQAIRSTRPGGHVGYVGVAHGVQLPGEELCHALTPRRLKETRNAHANATVGITALVV